MEEINKYEKKENIPYKRKKIQKTDQWKIERKRKQYRPKKKIQEKKEEEEKKEKRT